MNVTSTGSTANTPPVQVRQPAQQSGEAKEVGRDNDGDKDDAGVQAATPVPQPTVNGVGQVIGLLVNTTA